MNIHELLMATIEENILDKRMRHSQPHMTTCSLAITWLYLIVALLLPSHVQTPYATTLGRCLLHFNLVTRNQPRREG